MSEPPTFYRAHNGPLLGELVYLSVLVLKCFDFSKPVLPVDQVEINDQELNPEVKLLKLVTQSP